MLSIRGLQSGSIAARQNPIDRGREGADDDIRSRVGTALPITEIEKYSTASGLRAGVNVAPAVADHEAGGEIDIEIARRGLEHPRFRLAALAGIGAVMIADVDRVERHGSSQDGMNLFEGFAALSPAGEIGLVGDDNQQESRLAKPHESRPGARRDAELRYRARWIRLPIPNQGCIQDSIPIEEDGASQRTPSHFVCAAFSFGCDTSRCQTTA